MSGQTDANGTPITIYQMLGIKDPQTAQQAPATQPYAPQASNYQYQGIAPAMFQYTGTPAGHWLNTMNQLGPTVQAKMAGLLDSGSKAPAAK